MNRSIVLFLLFVAVSNAISLKDHKSTLSSFNSKRDVAALVCPGYSCGSSGGTCGLISTTSFVECPNDFVCNYTSGGSNGVCFPEAKVGAVCSSNPDYCVDGATCVNSVCTTITYTATVGQNCGDAVQCSGFLDCQGGVCVTLPNKGQSCNVTFECSQTSYCRSSNYICTDYFSIPLGGDCDDTDQCIPGIACIAGICTAVQPSSNKPCSTGLDCNLNEDCDCQATTKSQNATCTAQMTFTKSQANVYTTLNQCIQDNACTTTVEDCSKCKSAICNYYNQILLDMGAVYSLSCFGLTDFSTFCSSASHSFPATSLFFIILISVVALL